MSRRLEIAPQLIPASPTGNETSWDKFKEAIRMTTQKAVTPSIAISPAVIGLVITLFLQTVAGIWWAASLSKDMETNKARILQLEEDLGVQKVYSDNTREKFIKMEATLEAIQKDRQLEILLRQKETK